MDAFILDYEIKWSDNLKKKRKEKKKISFWG